MLHLSACKCRVPVVEGSFSLHSTALLANHFVPIRQQDFFERQAIQGKPSPPPSPSGSRIGSKSPAAPPPLVKVCRGGWPQLYSHPCECGLVTTPTYLDRRRREARQGARILTNSTTIRVLFAERRSRKVLSAHDYCRELGCPLIHRLALHSIYMGDRYIPTSGGPTWSFPKCENKC